MIAPFRLERRQRIDSTNDEARRLAAAGFGHGTVVTAVEQTAGRGRRGRAWMSPPGNLHCSFLLDADAAAAPQLTFVASLALRDALAELSDAEFRVKWPNDVLSGGAKISGMLLERADGLIILGVGVNIVAHPDNATSLGCSSADAVLEGFCRQLARRYDQWRKQGFAAIRKDWLAVAAGVGGLVTARLADETVRQGVFAGLDSDGALLLESGGQVSRILAADVFFSQR